MIIYLYKKTHNQTGYMYLGKTVSSDPHRYRGSGMLWRRHINKHGYDVTTEILKECNTKDELVFWGNYYSELWNVVDSDEWANLMPESGDGGDTSHTENYQKKRHLFSHKGENNPNYGVHRKWTNEQKLAVTGENNSQFGSKWSDDNRKNRGKNGYYWQGKKRPYSPRNYNFDGDSNPNAKKVMTPNGLFGSLKSAATGNGLSINQLYNRLATRPAEFYRVA